MQMIPWFLTTGEKEKVHKYMLCLGLVWLVFVCIFTLENITVILGKHVVINSIIFLQT